MVASHNQLLRLGTRDGLPDGIAFLRADHPRGGWRSHANFGQLAGFWLQVHAGLRREGDAAARIVDDFRERRTDGDQLRRDFVPQLNSFLGHLEQHHRIEDHAYFPKFRQLDARMVVGFDLLEADHQLIHHQLIVTVERARGLLNGLATAGEDARRAADEYAAESRILVELLLAHLSDEEDLVVPAILKHGERPLL